MTRHAAAQAAAEMAVMATEAAGEALASGASDFDVVLAGTAVAAMARMQRRLIERHGVVRAAWLMRSMLEQDCDIVVARSDGEVLEEISAWGCADDGSNTNRARENER